MPTVSKTIPGTYRDSVALMQLSLAMKRIDGIEEAAAIMATAGNLALAREVGLLEGEPDARSSDMLVIVRAVDANAAAAAFACVDEALKEKVIAAAAEGATAPMPAQSIRMAHAAATDANLVLISVPGDYAAAEASKAIDLGLNVMLFSDNVALDDEIALKQRAAERNLIVMGPDCGTAIVGGVPLAFANKVRRGAIGCVGASGTGLQQVTSLVDRLGGGISHALGTGGRDLTEAVGGQSMLAGLRMLAADEGTRVIVLVSKPPAPAVARKVLARASDAGKPVVVCFLGGDASAVVGANLHAVETLEDAAHAAMALARGELPSRRTQAVALPDVPPLTTRQRYVRGLYSGGTFAYESVILLGAALGKVWSNTPVRNDDELSDPWASREHSVIDLGDDVFTRGRPHPMIDHRLRNERILREAGDAEVAVILLDVVLGYGAHPDPAAALVPAIDAARAVAAGHERELAFVAFVCGTDADPQDLVRQENALRAAGVILAASNAQAARIAASIVTSSRSVTRTSNEGKR